MKKNKETLKKIKFYGIKVTKFIVWPMIWPIYQIRQTNKNCKQVAAKTKHQIQELKTNRDPWAAKAPDMNNFKQVLDHWKVQESEIDNLIGSFKAHIFIFTCFQIWGIYLLTGTMYSILHGIPLFFVGSIISITRLWRVQILQNRQFIFFKDWFLWGFFSKIGKETPFAQAKRLKKEGNK
ncbi:MAG: hypothetical protein GY718_05680 [Lentisphaerae bacterium]|nr:hypothetical protein [Lentisphaerota bacterium]